MSENSLQKAASLISHIPASSKGSYPLRAGNYICPLVDGEPAFRRICEAVEAARHSVWVTVAFLAEDFEMPDGRGSLFDVLDRARSRGLDVRVIFWRLNEGNDFFEGDVFSGRAAHRAWLKERGSSFHVRWDRAHKQYCQHQKSWLIDAGMPSEIAFVGGINLNSPSVVSPGHAEGTDTTTHDVYAELRGPSATDVHHNFVQRWNEASERSFDDGAWPELAVQSDLPFPEVSSPEAGQAFVQVQRTVRAGTYTDGTATPEGKAFPVHEGEFSIFEQYLAAIDGAQSTIYIEDQSIGTPEVVGKLDAALSRGVDVVVLVPADANHFMVEARKSPKSKPFFDQLAALGRHRNFALVGIAAEGEDGVLRNVYVHAKIALIDDHWATIGSCNIGARSFFGDTELNVSFWAPDVVRQLRCDLLSEHLDRDTRELDDRAALKFYQAVARQNAERQARGEALQGLAFSMDPASYGA